MELIKGRFQEFQFSQPLELAQDSVHLRSFGKNPVVIGAPHHTPKGKEMLPAGRPGDVNVGYLSLQLAKYLGCRAVIAVEASMDPNKGPCRYWDAVTSEMRDSSIYVEIHGHDGSKTKNDLEISTGNRDMTEPAMHLAREIRSELTRLRKVDPKSFPEFNVKAGAKTRVDMELYGRIIETKTSGDYDKIRWNASGTMLLKHVQKDVTGGEAAVYHLELPRYARVPGGDDMLPPKESMFLVAAIGNALMRLHPSEFKNRKDII